MIYLLISNTKNNHVIKHGKNTYIHVNINTHHLQKISFDEYIINVNPCQLDFVLSLEKCKTKHVLFKNSKNRRKIAKKLNVIRRLDIKLYFL